jgi:peptidyl-prolyl cis-trans isomerase B (cyclophilin B)
MKNVVIIIIALIVIMTGGMYLLSQNQSGDPQVTIQTDKGTIVVELYPELMPTTVENFVGLVEQGFFNGLVFHRVEDWVIQTGDPTGTGSGGSEQTIPLETHPELLNVKGAVGMARTQDPNSASSQFYILKQDAPYLDGEYAIFGKVIEGMDIVEQIQMGDVMVKIDSKQN